jgi:hypothetical protein
MVEATRGSKGEKEAPSKPLGKSSLGVSWGLLQRFNLKPNSLTPQFLQAMAKPAADTVAEADRGCCCRHMMKLVAVVEEMGHIMGQRGDAWLRVPRRERRGCRRRWPLGRDSW